MDCGSTYWLRCTELRSYRHRNSCVNEARSIDIIYRVEKKLISLQRASKQARARRARDACTSMHAPPSPPAASVGTGADTSCGNAVDYDERYRKGWAYGKAPSAFLVEISETPHDRPLDIISFGEGQGRMQCTSLPLVTSVLESTGQQSALRRLASWPRSRILQGGIFCGG